MSFQEGNLTQSSNSLLSHKVKKIFMDFPWIACHKFLWENLTIWAISPHPRKNAHSWIHHIYWVDQKVHSGFFIRSYFPEFHRHPESFPRDPRLTVLALPCVTHQCSSQWFRIKVLFPSAAWVCTSAWSLASCVSLIMLLSFSGPWCHHL